MPVLMFLLCVWVIVLVVCTPIYLKRRRKKADKTTEDTREYLDKSVYDLLCTTGLTEAEQLDTASRLREPDSLNEITKIFRKQLSEKRLKDACTTTDYFPVKIRECELEKIFWEQFTVGNFEDALEATKHTYVLQMLEWRMRIADKQLEKCDFDGATKTYLLLKNHVGFKIPDLILIFEKILKKQLEKNDKRGAGETKKIILDFTKKLSYGD